MVDGVTPGAVSARDPVRINLNGDVGVEPRAAPPVYFCASPTLPVLALGSLVGKGRQGRANVVAFSAVLMFNRPRGWKSETAGRCSRAGRMLA